MASSEPTTTPRSTKGRRNVSGAWVVYTEEYAAIEVGSLHADELLARRALDGVDGGKVVFVEWGQDVSDAVNPPKGPRAESPRAENVAAQKG